METHYKDRNPIETIKIIKNFFTSRGYNIEEKIEQNKMGLWCGTLKLLWIDNIALTSNGKGITKELCTASAYGELYERFCNKNRIHTNAIFAKKLAKYNYEKYGYYIQKGEKIITFENAVSNKLINRVLKKFLQNENIDEFKKCLSINFKNYIGVPFKNIKNDKDVIYIENRLLNSLITSTGMAAGNTLYEALVQGISELCERYVSYQLWHNQLQNLKYKYIDINNIENKEIKECISKIKSSGNDIMVFDLSYTFELPVVAVVYLNKKEKQFDINFGSHPIFEIALERTFTEMFQDGEYSNASKYTINKPPRKKETLKVFLDTSYCNKNYFPEGIIINSESVESYNNNIFITGNELTNNLDLYKYYVKLFDQKKISVYYLDVSLCDEITAIRLYSEELMEIESTIIENFFTEIITKEKLEYISSISRCLQSSTNEKTLSENSYKLSNIISKTNQLDTNIFYDLFCVKEYLFMYCVNRFNMKNFLLNIFEQKLDEVDVTDFCKSPIFNDFRKQMIIHNYKNNSMFNFKEIERFLNCLDITKQEIYDRDFIKNAILYPLYKVYNSDEYELYVRTYQRSDNQ